MKSFIVLIYSLIICLCVEGSEGNHKVNTLNTYRFRKRRTMILLMCRFLNVFSVKKYQISLHIGTIYFIWLTLTWF